jgi:hypothetical protein
VLRGASVGSCGGKFDGLEATTGLERTNPPLVELPKPRCRQHTYRHGTIRSAQRTPGMFSRSSARSAIHAIPGIGTAFCQAQPIRHEASTVIDISTLASTRSENSFESRNCQVVTALVNTYSTSADSKDGNTFESRNRTTVPTTLNTYSIPSSSGNSENPSESRNCTVSTPINTY